MKRLHVLSMLALPLCLSLSFPLFFLGCGDQEKVIIDVANQETKQVEFVTPVRSEQYAILANEFDLETEEVNFQVSEFSGGYTLKSGNLESELLSVKDTFIENMSSVLKLKEMNPENDSPGLYQDIQVAISSALQDRIFFSGANRAWAY